MKNSHCTFFLFLFLLAGGGISCNEKRVCPAERISFYHWGSHIRFSDNERQLLKDIESVSSGRIYVHYFDLTEENGVIQKYAEVHNQDTWPVHLTVVPVVFVENDVFKIRDDSLHLKMMKVVDRISMSFPDVAAEIQMDCDWTVETRENYFRFLHLMKRDFPERKLTATIRLHQIKFRERTGVPPVEGGVLMYYNMGKISADNRNSILDNAVGKAYLDRLEDYPLPLDVALPAYSWWIHIREGKPMGLISKWNVSPENDPLHFRKVSPYRYQVVQSGFLSGRYLMEGDIMKLEKSSETALTEAGEILRERLTNPLNEVIFFELDSTHISSYASNFFRSFVCLEE